MFTLNVKIDMSRAQILLDRAPEEFGNALERATIFGLQMLERAVKENIASPQGLRPYPAVDTHTLLDSVYSQARPRPEFGGIVDVHPPADTYAAAVELGTQPHMPPVDALLGWVSRHFGVMDSTTHHFRKHRLFDKTRKNPKTGEREKLSAEDREIKNIAWAIAKKIEREGTVGKHMFGLALTACEGPIIQKFNEEVQAGVAALEASTQTGA